MTSRGFEGPSGVVAWEQTHARALDELRKVRDSFFLVVMNDDDTEHSLLYVHASKSWDQAEVMLGHASEFAAAALRDIEEA